MLKETEIAFKKSRAFKEYGEEKNWGYSVLATSIFKNKPMVVGFNWGAAKNDSYEKQSEYPLRMFESNYNDLGALKRSIPYFYKYFPEALTGMQTNYCFFRSKHEAQISQEDLKLCSSLFFKLIKYSQPSSIVSFSSQLRDHLIENNLLMKIKVKEVKSKGINSIAMKGVSNFGLKNEIPIFCLPHPMSRVFDDDRTKLWEFCFK